MELEEARGMFFLSGSSGSSSVPAYADYVLSEDESPEEIKGSSPPPVERIVELPLIGAYRGTEPIALEGVNELTTEYTVPAPASNPKKRDKKKKPKKPIHADIEVELPKFEIIRSQPVKQTDKKPEKP
jgi:hypothetical protein